MKTSGRLNDGVCSRCGGRTFILIEVETYGNGLKHVRYLNKCRVCGNLSTIEELMIRRNDSGLAIYVKK